MSLLLGILTTGGEKMMDFKEEKAKLKNEIALGELREKAKYHELKLRKMEGDHRRSESILDAETKVKVESILGGECLAENESLKRTIQDLNAKVNSLKAKMDELCAKYEQAREDNGTLIAMNEKLRSGKNVVPEEQVATPVEDVTEQEPTEEIHEQEDKEQTEEVSQVKCNDDDWWGSSVEQQARKVYPEGTDPSFIAWQAQRAKEMDEKYGLSRQEWGKKRAERTAKKWAGTIAALERGAQREKEEAERKVAESMKVQEEKSVEDVKEEAPKMNAGYLDRKTTYTQEELLKLNTREVLELAVKEYALVVGITEDDVYNNSAPLNTRAIANLHPGFAVPLCFGLSPILTNGGRGKEEVCTIYTTALEEKAKRDAEEAARIAEEEAAEKKRKADAHANFLASRSKETIALSPNKDEIIVESVEEEKEELTEEDFTDPEPEGETSQEYQIRLAKGFYKYGVATNNEDIIERGMKVWIKNWKAKILVEKGWDWDSGEAREVADQISNKTCQGEPLDEVWEKMKQDKLSNKKLNEIFTIIVESAIDEGVIERKDVELDQKIEELAQSMAQPDLDLDHAMEKKMRDRREARASSLHNEKGNFDPFHDIKKTDTYAKHAEKREQTEEELEALHDQYRVCMKYRGWSNKQIEQAIADGLEPFMTLTTDDSETFEEAEESYEPNIVYRRNDSKPWINYWFLTEEEYEAARHKEMEYMRSIGEVDEE